MFSPRGLAGDGGHIQIQQALLGQLCLHGGDSACGIEVGHVGGAGGGQMAEVGVLALISLKSFRSMGTPAS